MLRECRPEDFTLRTMPGRFATVGDRHAAMDGSPCSLDALRELSARQEAEGLGDAPWPPHYARQAGEPPRVAPSRKKGAGGAGGRRVPKKPLVEVARTAKKEEALAGLERWHVPEELRPPQEAPDPEYDPWASFRSTKSGGTQKPLRRSPAERGKPVRRSRELVRTRSGTSRCWANRLL